MVKNRLAVALAVYGIILVDFASLRGAFVAVPVYVLCAGLGRALLARAGLMIRPDSSALVWMERRALETALGLAAFLLGSFLLISLGLPVLACATLLLLTGLLGWYLTWSVATPPPTGHATAAVLVVALAGLFLVQYADTMVILDGGRYFMDLVHPFYELSISHSALASEFVKPDLSYAGKAMRYHFLGPLLIGLLQRLGSLDGITMVLRVLPAIHALLIAALLAGLVRRITRQDYAAVLTVAFFLFLGGWLLPPALPFAESYVLGRYIALQPSAALGYIGSFALVAWAFEMRVIRSVWDGALIGVVLACFAFFSKAPFSIPFFVAAGLHALWELRQGRRQNLVILVGLAVALLPFAFYLSGAHKQNYWTLVPFPEFVQARLGVAPQTDATVITAMAVGFGRKVALTGFFPVGLALAWYLIRRHHQEGSPSSHGFPASLVATTGLVALALSTFVTETTEHNHLHFLGVWIWVGLMGIAWTLAELVRERGRILRAGVLGCVFAIMLGGILVDVILAVPRPRSAIRDPSLLVNAKVAAADGLLREFQRLRGAAWRAQWPEAARNFIPAATLDVLTGLSRSHLGAVILRGKHYEDLWWAERKTASWWAGAGFYASAFSGSQFLVEQSKYKGVAMEPEFLPRTVDTFRFYWWCTDRKTLWGGTSAWLPRVPVTDAAVRTVKQPDVFALLELKGDPSWHSASANIDRAMVALAQELRTESKTTTGRAEFCRSVLDRYGVTHVLFEHGERPDSVIAAQIGLTPLREEQGIKLYRVGNSRPHVY
jgi:hypothetical protein